MTGTEKWSSIKMTGTEKWSNNKNDWDREME